MSDGLFLSVGVVIIVATLLAYVARIIRQPLIPAYVDAGLIIGPGLGLITDKSIILALSEIGIAFLLFIVGLEIDLRRLKNVGIVAGLGGTIRSLILFSAGFLAMSMLGFKTMEAVYLGIVIAFSSTMVVVKLLADKKELDTLHGRIILGILLMEDILAVFALSILLTVNNFTASFLTASILKGVGVFIIAVLSGKYVFPRMFKVAAKSQELLFLSAVMVLFFFALLFNAFGFSISIGAFVAGVALANLPYNFEIIGKVTPLRDFFATIFFVSLGLQLAIGDFNLVIVPLAILFGICILLKPLITMFLVTFFGYKKRPAFLSAVALFQTSEFSLIIVTQGMLLGHVSSNIFTITVLLAISTIVLTTYFMNFDEKLYSMLAKKIKFFDRFAKANDDELEYMPRDKHEVVLCGYNRTGYSIYAALKKMKKNVLIVDFNPEVVKHLVKQKAPCIYGDVGDAEILEKMDLKDKEMVISTIYDLKDNILLIRKAKETNKKGIVIVTAREGEDAITLYEEGADYVILPHHLGGEHVSMLLVDFTKNISNVIRNKLKHIDELRKRPIFGAEQRIGKV